MMTYTTTITIYREDQVILVEAEVTPGRPGVTYGSPENCYPPESPEVGVISARLSTTGESVELTAGEHEDLIEMCERSSEAAYQDDLEARLEYLSEHHYWD